MPAASVLSSPANPLLKDVRQALQRGGLTSRGYCVAEGVRLLAEARRSAVKIQSILVAESAGARFGDSPEPVFVVSDRIFDKLSGVETAQGVMCLIEPPEWTIDRLFERRRVTVVLDGIQDPGNAGTIVRAAEAFGAAGVVFLKGSVNPFNAKVLRAAAGSLFRVPFIHGANARDLIDFVSGKGMPIYAALPTQGRERAPVPIEQVDLNEACSLVIGNEGAGVGEVFRCVAQGITIPTTGVESLNAAMAAAICLYEAGRQTRARA